MKKSIMFHAVWAVLASFAVAKLKRYQMQVQGDAMEALSVMNHAVADSESLFHAWSQLDGVLQSDAFTLEDVPIYVDANKDFVIQRIEIGNVEFLLQTSETRRLFRSHAMELFDGDCVCQTTEDDFKVIWLSTALRIADRAQGPVSIPGTGLTVQVWERSTVEPLPPLQPYVLRNCRHVSVSPTSWFNKESCGNTDQEASLLIVRASGFGRADTVPPRTLDLSSVGAQLVQRHFFRFHVPLESLRAGKIRRFFQKLTLRMSVRIRSRSFIRDARESLVSKIRNGVMASGTDIEFDNGFPGSFFGDPSLLFFTRIGEELEKHHLVTRIKEKHSKVLLPSVLSPDVPLTSIERDLYCMAGFALRYAHYEWSDAPRLHLGRSFEPVALHNILHMPVGTIFLSRIEAITKGIPALHRLFEPASINSRRFLQYMNKITSSQNEAANEIYYCYIQTSNDPPMSKTPVKALLKTLNVSSSHLRPSFFRLEGHRWFQLVFRDALFRDDWDLARKVFYSMTGSFETLSSYQIVLYPSLFDPRKAPTCVHYDGRIIGELYLRPEIEKISTDEYVESQWSIRYYITARLSSFSETKLKSTIDMNGETAIVILHGANVPIIDEQEAAAARKLIVYCYLLQCSHIAPVLAPFVNVESVQLRGLQLKFLDLTMMPQLKHVDVSYNNFVSFGDLELPPGVESVVMHHNWELQYRPETFPAWFQHTPFVSFGDLVTPESARVALLLKRPASSHTSIGVSFACDIFSERLQAKDLWKGAYIQFKESSSIFIFDNIIEFAKQAIDTTKIAYFVQSGLFSAVSSISKQYEVFQWSVNNVGHFLSETMFDHAQRTMTSCLTIRPLQERGTRFMLQNSCSHTTAMIVLSDPTTVFYLKGEVQAHVLLSKERLWREELKGIVPGPMSYHVLQHDKTYVCYEGACGVVEAHHMFLDQSNIVQSSILCLFGTTDYLKQHQWNHDFISVSFAGQTNGRHYGVTASWVDSVFQDMVQENSGGLVMSGETPNGEKIIIPSFLCFGYASAAPDQTALDKSIDVARLFGAMLAIVLNNNVLHAHEKHDGRIPYIYIPVSLDDAVIARLVDPTAGLTDKDLRNSVLFSLLHSEIEEGRFQESSFFHTLFPPAFQFYTVEEPDYGQFPGQELLKDKAKSHFDPSNVLPYVEQVYDELLSKENVFFDAMHSAFHSIIQGSLVSDGWVPQMLRDVMNKEVISSICLKDSFDFAPERDAAFPPLKAALLRFVDQSSEKERGDLMRYITGQRYWKPNGGKIVVNFSREKRDFAPMSFTCSSSLTLSNIPPGELAGALRNVISDATYS